MIIGDLYGDSIGFIWWFNWIYMVIQLDLTVIQLDLMVINMDDQWWFDGIYMVINSDHY